MSISTTVLFDVPQKEIASRIRAEIAASVDTRIVTGFMTVGGLDAISAPIIASPKRLHTLVVGAGTYPAFEALDDLCAAGVPNDRLFVHFGHTKRSGGKKHPYTRFHPMLHSKIYYMADDKGQATAFVGSHNMTAFALAGLNGEASIMLKGPANAPEFDQVRKHISTARQQSAIYSTDLKDAYAWWLREFIEGLQVEVKFPMGWQSGRTILIFAQALPRDRPKPGDNIYFEIPSGIEEIETLRTEVHLFLFDRLPGDPDAALLAAPTAAAKYTCITLGADNQQGNREVVAQWHIDRAPIPLLATVAEGQFRPNTPQGRQQVRAQVKSRDIVPYEYGFESEKIGWDPKFSHEQNDQLKVSVSEEQVRREANGPSAEAWQLVTGLQGKLGDKVVKDQAALNLAKPESGSFTLVSVRRRKRGSPEQA